jgi:hypothetical protein
MNVARRKRFEHIVWAYVVATGGRLPENLGDLLRAVREIIPDVSEREFSDALTWAIRRSKREGALLERRLRNEPAASRNAAGRKHGS